MRPVRPLGCHGGLVPSDQSALVDLLKKPGPKRIRNLKLALSTRFGESIEVIGVHRCLSAAFKEVPQFRETVLDFYNLATPRESPDTTLGTM